MKFENMTKLSLGLVLFVASINAFAVPGKDRVEFRKDTAAAARARTVAPSAESKSLAGLASRIGLVLETSKDKLANAIESKLEFESKFKTPEGEKSENLALKEIISDLANRFADLSKSRQNLANKVAESLTIERADVLDPLASKLIAESYALLSPGSKAADKEVESYLEKMTASLDKIEKGEVKNFDQAVRKVLTEQEIKDLENCIRG